MLITCQKMAALAVSAVFPLTWRSAARWLRWLGVLCARAVTRRQTINTECEAYFRQHYPHKLKYYTLTLGKPNAVPYSRAQMQAAQACAEDNSQQQSISKGIQRRRRLTAN